MLGQLSQHWGKPELQGLGGESFPVLVPNKRGLEDAVEVGACHFAFLLATSETFSQKNVNASVSQCLERLKAMGEKVVGSQIRVYISTAFGCPYEGSISPQVVREVVEKVLQLSLGPVEICLADTSGMGTPLVLDRVLKEVLSVVNVGDLSLHFHDTMGMALANILVALEHGVCSFDASAGGLGGVPTLSGHREMWRQKTWCT